VSSSDSERDKNVADVGEWTETEGARNLEQFLGVKGQTYVPSNPKSLPEAVDRFFGYEPFQLFVDQSTLYPRQNFSKYKTCPKSLVWKEVSVEEMKETPSKYNING